MMVSLSAKPGSAATLDNGALHDEEIVRRITREAEPALFEIIMRRYNQRLYRIIRGILGHDAETEDALQETYLHAFAQLHQFRGDAKFATWLTRIAVHEATRRRSRNRPMRSLNENADGITARPHRPAPAADHSPERSELKLALTESLDRLPEPLRTVVVLRDIEGLDTRETAECLHISEANVRVQLHRGREMLRADIDQKLGAEIRELYQFGAERCDRVVAAVMRRITAGAAPSHSTNW